MNPSQEPGPEPSEPQVVFPYGPTADPGWEPAPPPGRPWRRSVAVGALIVAAMAGAGVPLGLLWSWLSPSVPVVNAGANGIVVDDPAPEQYIAADGWFTIIGFAFGLLAAIVAWLVLRRDRGPAVLLGVTLGGLASTLVMWQAGRLVGLSAWQAWQRDSALGERFSRPPDLHAYGTLLVAAFAAVIVTTLLAGWANDPDLDRPGAKPGYGHDGGGGGSYPGLDGPAAGDPFSSGSPAAPDPTAAPAPPGPWRADPPRG